MVTRAGAAGTPWLAGFLAGRLARPGCIIIVVIIILLTIANII